MKATKQDGILPSSHPGVLPQRVGVLLINLGTPQACDYWSVRRYLSEFLSDKRVIDYPRWFWQPLLQLVILTSRPFRSGTAYASVWNKEADESYLRTYTRAITQKIERLFQQDENNASSVTVSYAMRYGQPSIPAMMKRLQEQGCQRILLMALYPQYSATTTATAYDKAFDFLKTVPWQPAIRTMSSWHDHPDYIRLLALSMQKAFDGMKEQPQRVLLSFHGLPQRYLTQGDPYHCHCQKTSRLVRQALGWPKEQWLTTFQSRFGPEAWLQPYTEPTLISLVQQGIKRVAVMSPAFICECIETLEEINTEAREKFLEAGGESFTYVPCLGDDDSHVEFLYQYLRQNLHGWIANTNSTPQPDTPSP